MTAITARLHKATNRLLFMMVNETTNQLFVRNVITKVIKNLWSWRESNPRPHKETMCFLHAYSRLHFRATARPGPPTGALSSKFSSVHRGLYRLFPIFLRRRFLRFGTTSLGRRPVPLPCKGIKLVIYCASIKQREHTCCCQLIFRPKRLWSLQSPSSACLHTISSRRQIQSTPF